MDLHPHFPPGMVGVLLKLPAQRKIHVEKPACVVYNTKEVIVVITEDQVKAEIGSVLPINVRKILVAGIRRGLSIYQDGVVEDRARLGYYANNRSTRDIFSSLCRGLELEIANTRSLLLQSKQQRTTSSYYIEITNPNLFIHVRNEKSDFPRYMLEKCKMNRAFQHGKQNYCVIAYPGERGEILSSIDFLVYDEEGNVVFREILDPALQNIRIA